MNSNPKSLAKQINRKLNRLSIYAMVSKNGVVLLSFKDGKEMRYAGTVLPDEHVNPLRHIIAKRNSEAVHKAFQERLEGERKFKQDKSDNLMAQMKEDYHRFVAENS